MSLGWEITVYRQSSGGASPATANSPYGALLATWVVGVRGLDWLDELVKESEAIYLGGNGYPFLYTAPAEYVLPKIIEVSAGARRLSGPPAPLVAQCRPDEWLIIEAMDQS
jgi:hypothetical protein